MSYYQALGLVREPFSTSPDPDLLYRSKNHLDCLQHMEIAVRLRRGLNVVLGEVGTGKTTLGRELQRTLVADPDIEVHFLDDPYFPDVESFLVALARLFGLEVAGMERDQGRLKEAIKAALLRRGSDGRRIVTLIVDEGQKITGDCLELLRELLNFETNTSKLLQIVMFAQQEFDAVLTARPNLDDRVNFRYELRPLNRQQTRRMIEARLNLCSPDGQCPRMFTDLAFRRIHRLTGGYPRKIVRLCHMAMLHVVGNGHRLVTWGMVGRASREMRGLSVGSWPRRLALAAAFGALAGTLVMTGLGMESISRMHEARARLGAPVHGAAAVLPEPSPVAPGQADPAAAPAPAVVEGPASTEAPAAPDLAAAPAPTQKAAQTEIAATPASPVLPEVRGQAVSPPNRDPANVAVSGGAPTLARAHNFLPPRIATASPAVSKPQVPVAQEPVSVPAEPAAPAAPVVATAAAPVVTAAAPEVAVRDNAPAVPQAPQRAERNPAIALADASKDKAGDEGVIVVTATESAMLQPLPTCLGEAVTRHGWTVSRQALWVYGNPGRAILGQLAKANPGMDFDRIRAGQSITFPAIETSPPPRGMRILSLGSVESLEKGMALLSTMTESPVPLVLFVTHQPGKGLCVEVVAYALYDDVAAGEAALATLPPRLAAKARLVEQFPKGTVFFTDLTPSSGKRYQNKPGLPAPARRQVAETETH